MLLALLVGTLPVTALADAPSSWAEPHVREAIRVNIVPSRLQSNYTQPITRAEFAALGVRFYEVAKRQRISARMSFNDTTDRNVEQMGGLGIISGVGGGNFNPDGYITREQAAVMTVRLAQAFGAELPMEPPAFYDNDLISSWAIEAVGQAQALGLMGGTSGNMFSPKGTYTREQSIVTMLRLFNLVNVRVSLQTQNITTEQLHQMIATGEIPINVTHLDLVSNEITDLSPLRVLTNLKELSLWGNQVSDLSPLSYLTNLRVLSLQYNQITDISPLSNLTNLVRLDLSDNQFTNIAPLSSLTNLEDLRLWQSHHLDGDISILSNLTNLTFLSLGSYQITDFSPIKNLVNLDYLGLDNTYQLEDLSFINNLRNLTALSLFGTPLIDDFMPISNLQNLRSLILFGNQLQCISRLPLQSLPNLIVLTVGANEITDIYPLKGFTQLTSIRLPDNQITDISILSGFVNLSSLDLNNNQITDISPIFGLSNLRAVWLYENPLDDDQIAALLLAFPDGVQIEI